MVGGVAEWTVKRVAFVVRTAPRAAGVGLASPLVVVDLKSGRSSDAVRVSRLTSAWGGTRARGGIQKCCMACREGSSS